jgi:predicted nucleic acid-binding protein
LTAFVLDGSVTLAWLLNEPPSPASSSAERWMEGGRAAAPDIWIYEVANVVALKRRLGAIDARGYRLIREALAAYRVRLVELEAELLLGPVADLAVKHRLTVYEAAYLFVALDLDLPLATLDRDLVRAARVDNVRIVGA